MLIVLMPSCFDTEQRIAHVYCGKRFVLINLERPVNEYH